MRALHHTNYADKYRSVCKSQYVVIARMLISLKNGPVKILLGPSGPRHFNVRAIFWLGNTIYFPKDFSSPPFSVWDSCKPSHFLDLLNPNLLPPPTRFLTMRRRPWARAPPATPPPRTARLPAAPPEKKGLARRRINLQHFLFSIFNILCF